MEIFMQVQRLVRDDVDGQKPLETVRIYFYVLLDPITFAIRYVGQTVNPRNRLSNHIYESKRYNRTHKHRWIVQLLRKNKEPIMDLLFDQVMTSDEGDLQESNLIDYYKSIGCNLTNTEDRARNNSVIETTPVYQFTLDGEFLQRFPNANQAMLITGVSDSSIGEVCKYPFKAGNNSRGGFLWSFTDKPNKPYCKPKGTPKKIVQLTLDGTVIKVYQSARLASKETGVGYKKISTCITGRQKSAGGYLWKVYEDIV